MTDEEFSEVEKFLGEVRSLKGEISRLNEVKSRLVEKPSGLIAISEYSQGLIRTGTKSESKEYSNLGPQLMERILNSVKEVVISHLEEEIENKKNKFKELNLLSLYSDALKAEAGITTSTGEFPVTPVPASEEVEYKPVSSDEFLDSI